CFTRNDSTLESESQPASHTKFRIPPYSSLRPARDATTAANPPAMKRLMTYPEQFPKQRTGD
ncbi:hypothetical protein, partial [Burkholderia multivorans]